MIKEIKIENFKSIQSLNLELGRLNVFIGANGSGKSNILEGIAIGRAAIDNKLDSEFLFARGIRVIDDIYTPSNFESENDKPVKIIFVDKEPISIEINKGGFIVDLPKNSLFAPKVTGDRMRIESTHSHNGNPPFIIYAPENTYLRNFVEEGQIKPMGFRGEGLFDHLVEIFKQKPKYFAKINKHLLLLEWFEGFEIPNDLMLMERRIKIKDHFLEDGLQYIDQRSANEGFLYLLFYLALFISDKTPKFFAIDNIDNAMNPKLGRELIKILAKLAKEHDKQAILTTHNPSVLDGLDLSDDEQRLFVISRNKSGHTQAIRVLYKESDERLSTRFIRGAIGGLPKNF